MAAPPANPNTTNGPAPVPLASLNGANLSPTDRFGYYNESVNNNNNNLFTDFEIVNEYEYDKHIYGAGVTAPEGIAGKTLSLFQLCTPTLLWICSWTASKFGQCPEYPDPTPSDSNWVLLDTIPESAQLALAPDGVTPLYRLSGVYVYMHQNPSDEVYRQVAFPRPAWLENSFNREVPSNKKTKNLIDTNQQGGNGGVLNFPVA